MLGLSTFNQALRTILRHAGGRTPIPSTPALLPHPFDLLHGTDTSGLIEGPDLLTGHPNDAFTTAYYAMAPSRFHWIVEQWIADPTHPAVAGYSFLDLGCGKARAVMMACEYPFRQAIGAELHPALAHIAIRNLALWQRQDRSPGPAQLLCPAQILCQDATEFVFPQGPCLLYLFHPFAAPILQKIIHRIESVFAARPGLLDIIYFNPEAGALFASHPGFELLWTGAVPMSDEDAAADALASPEDLCSVFRWTGTAP